MYKSFVYGAITSFFLAATSVSAQAFQSPVPFSFQPEKFPPSEQVFQIDYSQIDAELRVRFDISKGFYLYQHRFGFTPEDKVYRVHPLPEGEHYSDEFFGDTIIYREHVELVVDLNAANRNEILNIHLQGCADEGFCYPPTTQQIYLRKTNGVAHDEAESVSTPAEPMPQTAAPSTASRFLKGAVQGAIVTATILLAILVVVRLRKK